MAHRVNFIPTKITHTEIHIIYSICYEFHITIHHIIPRSLPLMEDAEHALQALRVKDPPLKVNTSTPGT